MLCICEVVLTKDLQRECVAVPYFIRQQQSPLLAVIQAASCHKAELCQCLGVVHGLEERCW